MSGSTTIQAIRAHDYGGPEVLLLEQVPRPEPQKDQVLIRVKAAGIPSIGRRGPDFINSSCRFRSHGHRGLKLRER